MESNLKNLLRLFQFENFSLSLKKMNIEELKEISEYANDLDNEETKQKVINRIEELSKKYKFKYILTL